MNQQNTQDERCQISLPSFFWLKLHATKSGNGVCINRHTARVGLIDALAAFLQSGRSKRCSCLLEKQQLLAEMFQLR